MSQRIVFWWNSACRSIMPLVRELSSLHSAGVRIVVKEEISTNRKNFGWTPEAGNGVQLDVLRKPYKSDLRSIVEEEQDSLHVFGGFQRQSVFLNAIGICKKKGVAFGVMAEAPINSNRGWRKAAKHVYLGSIVRFQTRFVESHARFLVCLSGRRYDECMRVGWPFDKIFPFGYFTAPPPMPTFEKHSNRGDKLRVLCLGALVEAKGVELLVDAAAWALRQGANLEINILGDGVLRTSLEERARRRGMSSNDIRFHGFVPDEEVQRFKAGSDLLVCPGYEEPWGIRINEGLQSGLALLCSDRIGASELVVASRAGLLFRSGDFGELAELLRWLSKNPKVVTEYKENALRFNPCIHPRIAARHFLSVLDYINGGGITRPGIPWDVLNDRTGGDSHAR